MNRLEKEGAPGPRSILVVLPTWVGDFVMATPLLRAVRRRFSNSHIAFLTESNLRELIRGGDWMDECLEWPGRELRSPRHQAYRDFVLNLRRRRFDWAVLLPNSFWSAFLAWFIGAKRRIGYARDGRGFLLTDRLRPPNFRRGWERMAEQAAEEVWGPRDAWNAPVVRLGARLPNRLGRFVPMPLVEYYAELALAVGCEHPGDRLELFATPDCDERMDRRLAAAGIAARRPLVVLSPGAKFGASKCWMPDRFAAVADRLIAENEAAVVMTCGPGEEPIVRAIASAMRQKGAAWDDPTPTLGELKSLIRRSQLWIGNDAGPRHIAKAFGVPAVTVFGPTHPDWTATRHRDERIVRMDVECGPCQQRVCPLGHHQCMTGVTVDRVYEAAREMLQRRISSAEESVGAE